MSPRGNTKSRCICCSYPLYNLQQQLAKRRERGDMAGSLCELIACNHQSSHFSIARGVSCLKDGQYDPVHDQRKPIQSDSSISISVIAEASTGFHCTTSFTYFDDAGATASMNIRFPIVVVASSSPLRPLTEGCSDDGCFNVESTC